VRDGVVVPVGVSVRVGRGTVTRIRLVGRAVGVEVEVGVSVNVAVGVLVTVSVAVAVSDAVGVELWVGRPTIGRGVAVRLRGRTWVGVAVRPNRWMVRCGVAVLVAVCRGVGVAVGVTVLVRDGVAVRVLVRVGVRVRVDPATVMVTLVEPASLVASRTKVLNPGGSGAFPVNGMLVPLIAL
jgi:hypothetical protein